MFYEKTEHYYYLLELHIIVFQDQDDVFEKVKTEVGKTLPLIICRTKDDLRKGDYLLRVNRNIMDVPGGFIAALEILIKFNILLGIAFPKELQEFYDLILGGIMEKHKPSANSQCLLDTLNALADN